MGNKEILVGVGILGLFTYLHFRNSRSDFILENKFEEAIQHENFTQTRSNIITTYTQELKNRLSNISFAPVPSQTSSRAARLRRFNVIADNRGLLAEKNDIMRKLAEIVKFPEPINTNKILEL